MALLFVGILNNSWILATEFYIVNSFLFKFPSINSERSYSL